MGAFGSCLGVGRPIRPGANPRLVGTNVYNVDVNPFGPKPNSNGRQLNAMRGPLSSGLTRNSFLNGSPASRNGQPVVKLVRQLSSLSGKQALFNNNSPTTQQNVPKLVDIDDQPTPQQQKQNSHLNCNRRQSSQLNPSSSSAAVLLNGSENGGISVFVHRLMKEPSKIKSLIALYDYEPRTNEDLGFHKGEHMESISDYMQDDWWLVRSKSTKEVGYVPSNYVAELKSLTSESWYHGKCGRSEAEYLLMLPINKDGAFIIRDSDTQPGQYSLSLKLESSIKHYKIKQFDTGGFYIDKKTVFSTIHDLVSHYSRASYGLIINLREPCCRRTDRPVISGLSHETSDMWEIERETLSLLHELGRGQFGQVFEGLYKGQTRVAIKTLRKGSMDPKDFLAEAQIMKKMRHDNLVCLYAVCTKEEPVYIVTELMSKGALISYLQTDEGKNLPLSGYINMATQIASGMLYLEREKYVHRDLAARNILVGENNVCKIADFGLARFIKESEYEARVGARFPIKWTAPEAANFSKFTIKSDVWSFGIVLYEIITKGGTPYPDMTNADVIIRIENGYRMPQPPFCEAKYYKIMLSCWYKEPNKRPTFEALHDDLSNYFASDEQYREASQFRIN